jgi:hypothetical protein
VCGGFQIKVENGRDLEAVAYQAFQTVTQLSGIKQIRHLFAK